MRRDGVWETFYIEKNSVSVDLIPRINANDESRISPTGKEIRCLPMHSFLHNTIVDSAGMPNAADGNH